MALRKRLDGLQWIHINEYWMKGGAFGGLMF